MKGPEENHSGVQEKTPLGPGNHGPPGTQLGRNMVGVRTTRVWTPRHGNTGIEIRPPRGVSP